MLLPYFSFFLNYTNDFYLDLSSDYIGVYRCKKRDNILNTCVLFFIYLNKDLYIPYMYIYT